MKKENNLQDFINNLRFSALEVMTQNQEQNGAKALQATPFMYALFRNHFTSVSDGTAHNLNDHLVVGKNYGGGLLKTFIYASRLYDEKKFPDVQLPHLNQLNLPANVHDFNRSEDCDALGFATGLALGQLKVNSNCFNNHSAPKVYCVFGQEEVTSGKFYEILSFAGRQKLSNLICLVDFSGVDATGFFNNHSATDYRNMVESMGWKYLAVRDGSSVSDISKVIQRGQKQSKPVFIEINTIAAHGSSVAGTYMGWNTNISNEELLLLKERFEYDNQPHELLAWGINELDNLISNRNQQRHQHPLSTNEDSVNTSAKAEFVVDDESSLINLIVNQQAFDVVLLCSSNISNFDQSLIANQQIITFGGRYLAAPLIAAGIKCFANQNVLVISDQTLYSSWKNVATNPITKKYAYTTLMIGQDSNSKVDVDREKFNFWYPYDLLSFNQAWMATQPNQWNMIFYPSDSINKSNYQNKVVSDNQPQLNLFSVALSVDDINLLKAQLSQKNLVTNFVALVDWNDLVQQKIKISNSAPIVIVSPEWLSLYNVQSLPFNNKKFLVKFNKQSITSICSQLIEISQK